jgi:hypothetical protein
MRILSPVSTAIKAIVVAFFIGLIIGLTVAAKAASTTHQPDRPRRWTKPSSLGAALIATLKTGSQVTISVPSIVDVWTPRQRPG